MLPPQEMRGTYFIMRIRTAGRYPGVILDRNVLCAKGNRGMYVVQALCRLSYLGVASGGSRTHDLLIYH